MDPELGVVCFRTDDLRRPAVLVNYTAHPVVVYADPRHHLAGTVSADWPGALAACLEESAGTGTVVVTNGACGNINPWNPFDPDYEKFTDHVRMGRLCAETARTVLGAMEFEADAPLAAESAVVEIPLREVPAEAAAAAERVLADHPSPRWTDGTRTRVEREWLNAAMTAQLARARREKPTFSYEIQVMRIGPAALVGLPGEPFAEIGLAIKLASPARHTYIVHCVNQYVGYIPTREAFARGGHEVNTSAWSRLSPDACDTIRDASAALLRKAFA